MARYYSPFEVVPIPPELLTPAPRDASTAFTKYVEGGPDPVGDWCRRVKADGGSSTALTAGQVAAAGAGFWPDMMRMNLAGGGDGGGGGPPVITGTPVYVDSVAGLDTNDGLTTGTAKQTIAGLTAILADDMVINLARGGFWRESLNTSPYSGIFVQAYGSGRMPILDCSDIVPNSGWTNVGGASPNVWQKVINSGADLYTMFASMWVDDVRLKWVPSIATVNSTPGTFTILGSSIGAYQPTTTTFQVNTGGNPNTDGKKYEYAARNYAYQGSNGAVVSNLHTRRNAHNNGSFAAGSNAIVSNCIFEDGSKHNCYCSPGTVMTDCIAWNCDFQAAERDGWIAIVSHNTTNHGTEVNTFIRCQVVIDINTLTSLQNGITGFYSHTDGSPGSTWGKITYTDCSCQYIQSPFSAMDTLSVEHTRSHAKGCLAGIVCPYGDNNLASPNANNTLTDCWVEESDGLTCIRAALPGGATCMIDGLRVCISSGGNDGHIYGGMRPGTTIQRSAFTRSTAASGYMLYIRAESSTGGLVTGNVLWGPNTGFGEQLLYLATATLDHNAYGGGNADCSANGSGTLKPPGYLTTAQAAGSEAGSVSLTANPFTNAPAGDFTLKASSGLSSSVFGCARFPTYQHIYTAAEIAAM